MLTGQVEQVFKANVKAERGYCRDGHTLLNY